MMSGRALLSYVVPEPVERLHELDTLRLYSLTSLYSVVSNAAGRTVYSASPVTPGNAPKPVSTNAHSVVYVLVLVSFRVLVVWYLGMLIRGC